MVAAQLGARQSYQSNKGGESNSLGDGAASVMVQTRFALITGLALILLGLGPQVDAQTTGAIDQSGKGNAAKTDSKAKTDNKTDKKSDAKKAESKKPDG